MSDSADKSQVHIVLLGLFTVLFALRVGAQLVQYAIPTRFLPLFDAWQGSGLAYPTRSLSRAAALQLLTPSSAIAASAGSVCRSASAFRRRTVRAHHVMPPVMNSAAGTNPSTIHAHLKLMPQDRPKCRFTSRRTSQSPG